MTTAVYNEIEPYAAAWIRNLVAAGHVVTGDVDERSIRGLQRKDVEQHDQAHFFAGIGVWSRALRLAGWPDSLPVWTGSCPCQPFSSAGRRKGTADDRHLWPEWWRLIKQCRPTVVFGEQVASPDGLRWLDAVFADLEGAGYACGAADLCAAGVGAPHIRQRLYFVALAHGERLERLRVQLRERGPRQAVPEARGGGEAGDGELADAGGDERGEGRRRTPLPGRAVAGRQAQQPSGRGDDGRFMGDAVRAGPQERPWTAVGRGSVRDEGQASAAPSAPGFWSAVEWLPCEDGRIRPTQPGPQQMADGFAEMLGRLRPDARQTIEEVVRHESDEDGAREALRDLWCDLAAKSVRRTPRRLRSVHEAPILLTVMRELAREEWSLLDHLPQACWVSPEDGLRALRKVSPEAPRTPSRRKSEQQRPEQPGNALSVLSSALARAADEAGMIPFPLAYGVANRVGKLRAYGNAIVPQVAAQFIGSVMDLLVGNYP